MSTRRRATPSIASGAPSRSTLSACADRSSPWPHGRRVDPWVTSPRPPSEGWYSGPVAGMVAALAPWTCPLSTPWPLGAGPGGRKGWAGGGESKDQVAATATSQQPSLPRRPPTAPDRGSPACSRLPLWAREERAIAARVPTRWCGTHSRSPTPAFVPTTTQALVGLVLVGLRLFAARA